MQDHAAASGCSALMVDPAPSSKTEKRIFLLFMRALPDFHPTLMGADGGPILPGFR
jgi:hypothetical protein